MPDITMCMNDSCQHRVECYRYRAVPYPFAQAYAAFKPNENGTCTDFYQIESRHKLKEQEAK